MLFSVAPPKTDSSILLKIFSHVGMTLLLMWHDFYFGTGMGSEDTER